MYNLIWKIKLNHQSAVKEISALLGNNKQRSKNFSLKGACIFVITVGYWNMASIHAPPLRLKIRRFTLHKDQATNICGLHMVTYYIQYCWYSHFLYRSKWYLYIYWRKILLRLAVLLYYMQYPCPIILQLSIIQDDIISMINTLARLARFALCVASPYA